MDQQTPRRDQAAGLHSATRAAAPMLERTPSTQNVIDVLDRVLDKGIVIDAWVRVSLVGIELVTVQARVIVASISTYLGYAGALDQLKEGTAPRPDSSPTIG